MTTIMDCIEEISECLKGFINTQGELFDKLSNQLNHKSYSKIVIVASGLSYNVAFAVKKLGIELLGKDIELFYC